MLSIFPKTKLYTTSLLPCAINETNACYKTEPQRPYHKKAHQCLRFIFNLANPDSNPPSDEAIERRMAYFRSIPVPRCKEEREARKLERVPRKRIVRRVVKIVRKVVRETPEPEEFKCSLIFDSLYQ